MSRGFIQTISSYISFRFRSKTKYHIHSPFVFELIERVFENKVRPPVLEEVHELYLAQCRNSRVLETTDFGASRGRMTYTTKFLTVSEIARSSSIKRKSGELLFRLVEWFKPGNILELGTALGVSSLYMARAAPDARIITMEGCAAKVEMAKANFAKLDVSTIEISTGRFDTQLSMVLQKMPSPDFVFIDGHHQYKPTVEYFSQILKHSHEDTVIVLDDIHWSTGMEKAWKEIRGLPEVIVTIELYRFGLVFLRKSLSKQNFVIRY